MVRNICWRLSRGAGYFRLHPHHDVAPGEAIFISNEGESFVISALLTRAWCPVSSSTCTLPDRTPLSTIYRSTKAVFEWVNAAKKILSQYSQQDHDIDVVIPIPDTGRTAALPLAHELGTKYREGFVKNRYIGRTFIMPGQKQRRESVRQKLNAIDLEFKDKNVLLVDDSIVRGTTITQIIQLAREAGARKVYKPVPHLLALSECLRHRYAGS